MTAAGMFDHVLALSDHLGTFEHAEFQAPRREHGYCVDDVARVLIAVAREPRPSQDLLHLARTSFRFLTEAQAVDGRVRNRRRHTGRWVGRHGVDDCWGRGLWAFGTAARRAPERWMAESSIAYFERGAEQRSAWPRAMAFAGLGAAEVLAGDPRHPRARALLGDAVTVIGRPSADGEWRWPEPRLQYANAALAEVLIAAGSLLDRPEVLADGLAMLEWLVGRETVDHHLSVTPAGGAGPEDAAGRFDQQPIEVAAMADACLRAAVVTGDGRWFERFARADRWFDGANDAGVVMFDPTTGGGFDGLHVAGPNMNQGAESTLALVTVRQHARALALAGS
jgi:hypothetical protein